MLKATIFIAFCMVFILLGCDGSQQSETPQKILPTPLPGGSDLNSGKPTSLPGPASSSGSSVSTIDPNCTYQFSSEPANRSTGVLKDTSITITSDVAMDVATIDFGSLIVTGAVSGNIQGTVITPTSGTVMSIIFNPDEYLSRGEMITVSFQPDLDPCRGFLEEPYVFQFVVDTEGYIPSFIDSGQRIGAPGRLLDMVALDVNGDDFLDIFRVGTAAATTQWYSLVNDSRGYFSTSPPVSREYTVSVAASDLNRDGVTDLMYASHLPDKRLSTSPMGVLGFISHGDSFRKKVHWHKNPYSNCINNGCSHPRTFGGRTPKIDFDGLESADLDGDGFPEVIIRWLDPSQPYNTWFHYLSHVSVHSSVLFPFHGFFAHEFNEEISVDLVLATLTAQDYSLDIPASDIAIGDMDGDGDDDLVILENNILDRPASTPDTIANGFHILMDDNSSLRSYELTNKQPPHPSTNIVYKFQPESVALGDVDGDGDLDLLFSGQKYHLLKINSGNGGFTEGTWLLDVIYNHSRNDVNNANISYGRVTLVDLDGDGDKDIYNGAGYVFLNNGFGDFNEGPLSIVPEHVQRDYSSHQDPDYFIYVMEDFDNDEDVDIVFDSPQKLQIWFNDLYQPSPLPDPTGLKVSKTPGPTSNSGMTTGPAGMPKPKKDDSASGLPSGSGTTAGSAGLPTGNRTYPSSSGATAGPVTSPKSSDDAPNPILPSGTTMLADDVTTGNVWIKEALESGSEDAGQMVRMSYEWPDNIHMVYQVQEGNGPKKIFYKSYDVQSSTHSASEGIAGVVEGDEQPGDIESECGVLDVEEDTPVCISYYHDGDLWGAWYKEREDTGSGFSREGPWHQKKVDEDGNVGNYSSILIDTSGLAHMIYYSDTGNDLMHISQADADTEWSTWEVPEVVDGKSTGRDRHAGQYATASINKINNEIEEIHVLYRTSDKRISHLYSILDNSQEYEREWEKTTVVADGWTKSHISMDLDSNGNPHAVYYHAGVHDLMYAWATQNVEGEWVWQVEPIETEGKVGEYASIVMQPGPLMDKPHVSYYDETNGVLRYATKMLNPGLGAMTWVTETVDNPAETDVGKFTDIIVAEDGTVYIAYYDETNGDLKLAHN